MDGNSFSQSTKSMLLSNSLLFKMNTLFPEFWYGWMKPWEHFVPVDFLNYEREEDFLDDLNEKIDWADAHPEEARKIANQSTHFAMHQLREIDVLCYVFRLMLEYHDRMVSSPKILPTPTPQESDNNETKEEEPLSNGQEDEIGIEVKDAFGRGGKPFAS